jgi:hypothetical protein
MVVLVACTVLAAGGAIWLIRGSIHPRVTEVTPRAVAPTLRVEALGGGEFAESGIEGHRDFRFENPAERPLTVAVEVKNCQCSGLQFRLLAEALHWLERSELRQLADESGPPWQNLEPGGAKLTIPSRAVGLVRMRWKAEAVGDHLFWAELSLDDGEQQGSLRLEVPVQFIEPVRVRVAADPKRAEGDFGKFGMGEAHTVEFFCFSLTRERFTLSAPHGDACFEQAAPRPMSPEELHALSERIGQTVLAGYRAAVTVHEHVGERHLDLGPFHRKIVWPTDVAAGNEAYTFANGTILGEVRLAGQKKGYVDLGNIIPARPTPVEFTLESDTPGFRLALDENRTLEFLKVELLDGPEGKPIEKGTQWRARVIFKADSLFRGKFPVRERLGYDTDVSCSIAFVLSDAAPSSQKTRRLLVPVHGNVFADR